MYNFIFGNISICGGIFIFIFLRKIKKYKKKVIIIFQGKCFPAPFNQNKHAPTAHCFQNQCEENLAAGITGLIEIGVAELLNV